MLAALRGSGLLIVTVCAVVSLAILIVLGNWQWQRKAWKEDLIAQLEANAVAKPEPIADVQQGSTDSGADALRFRRVVLKGELRNDLEMHYWQPTNRGPGWSIIVPLVLERPFTWQGEPDKLVKAVLVDRGVVVEADKDVDLARAAPGRVVDGPVQVVGRIRMGEAPGPFVTQANLDQNQWYTRDLSTMAEFVRRRDADLADQLAPVFVEAERQFPGAGAPRPVLSKLSLSNRHLAYALTWWGLGATLCGVYLAFVVSRLRGRGRKSNAA